MLIQGHVFGENIHLACMGYVIWFTGLTVGSFQTVESKSRAHFLRFLVFTFQNHRQKQCQNNIKNQ